MRGETTQRGSAQRPTGGSIKGLRIKRKKGKGGKIHLLCNTSMYMCRVGWRGNVGKTVTEKERKRKKIKQKKSVHINSISTSTEASIGLWEALHTRSKGR